MARSAERAGQGRRSDLAGNQPGSKLSLRVFAKLAGVDRATAAFYLDAWERAAADSLVPPAASLQPGADVDLSHLDARAWARYYTGRPAKPKPVAEVDWAKEAIRAVQAPKVAGTGPLQGGRWPSAHCDFDDFIERVRRLPLRERKWSPERATSWAEALATALTRIPPSKLSDPRRLAAQLREEADRHEAAAPGDEGSR